MIKKHFLHSGAQCCWVYPKCLWAKVELHFGKLSVYCRPHGKTKAGGKPGGHKLHSNYGVWQNKSNISSTIAICRCYRWIKWSVWIIIIIKSCTMRLMIIVFVFVCLLSRMVAMFFSFILVIAFSKYKAPF